MNEGLKGGETQFLESATKPETGKELIFKHELVYAELPVLEGVKYVLRTNIKYLIIN